eukprot:CAMPEP_0178521180 /NCGR_PEP_ID=MMETSP0696-20121128/27807_1 /TAXON_ID=265572 /ORGANISM="Extubocellulus spinifer, Strain CCMP396" /LENGTH=57 /DNA_ID=CAMNT_0020152101 /DNA_START=385 /DNA_END=555 /DNA_ORIENTATION=+
MEHVAAGETNRVGEDRFRADGTVLSYSYETLPEASKIHGTIAGAREDTNVAQALEIL